ncbi:MAG: type II toxin-antitoxin system HipA family toxin YjjJ [Verrucomicrobia bacterium]|nr:type II toxin-antitoxin system HipA family toxin YjjJ [Verrucomicrobiota bacterium]
MPRPAQITAADLTLRLQAGGALTAQALADALDVDRSTVARGLARLGAAVVPLGAARRTRYALRRPVRTVGDRWAISRIDDAGRAREWARLHAMHGGWWIEWAGEPPAWAECAVDRDGFLDGLPFFLGDLWPQGFLGRILARRLADALRVPSDPRHWGDDDTLVFLQAEGDDLPGDLVVGGEPLRRVLASALAASPEMAMPETERPARYPELAVRAMASERPGSSVGGEQPKFLAMVRRDDGAVQPVLVKFSPPMETPVGRAWADLLAAESHALAVLAEHGLATPGATTLDAGGRRFLEVIRHDRVGAHGRRGVVSLAALHASLAGGAANDWPAAAEALVHAGLIDQNGLAVVQRLHGFGELIGNSDMHFGNLSFWLDDALPFRPAPAYDMLPMAWAPERYGEVAGPAQRVFAPRPPLPAGLAVWREAAAWASEFWRRVGEDAAVSRFSAARAREAGAIVARMREHFDHE